MFDIRDMWRDTAILFESTQLRREHAENPIATAPAQIEGTMIDGNMTKC